MGKTLNDLDMNGMNATGGCVLPVNPPHGSFSFKTCDLKNDVQNQIYSPGSVVKSHCILALLCDSGYRLTEQSHEGYLQCDNSSWRQQPREMGCEEMKLNMQPALSNSTLVDCVLPADARHRKFFSWFPDPNGNLRSYPPGARVEEGSIKVVCESGYKLPDAAEYFTIICFENSWISGSIPECKLLEDRLAISTTSAKPDLTESIDDIFASTTLDYNTPDYTFPPVTGSAEHEEPPHEEPAHEEPPHEGGYGHGGYLEKACDLPKEKKNRIYLSWNWNSNSSYVWTHQPGSAVAVENLIKMQCEPGYGLSDYKNFMTLYCDETLEWTPRGFPDCMKMCPPLESHSMYVTCSYIDSETGLRREVDCHKEMLPTTVARYTCKPGYSEYSCLAEDGVYRRTLTCRQDGRWSSILPECSSVSDTISSPVKIKLLGSSGAILGGCFLPEEPNNRIFFPVNSKRSKLTDMYSPGAKVKGVVVVRCVDGYVLPGNKTETRIFCDEDYWIPDEMPECKVSGAASQPKIPQYGSVAVFKGCSLPEEPQHRVFLPGVRTKNSKQVEKYSPGAKVNGEVEIRCDDGYVLPENQKQIKIFCNEDHWIPEEMPECKVNKLLGSFENKNSGNLVLQNLSSVQESPECVIPQGPNKKYFPFKSAVNSDSVEIRYLPGARVSGQIKVQCEAGYGFPGNKNHVIIGCYNGKWLPESVRECVKTCHPLHSSSMYMTCTYGSKRVDCSKPMLPTTTATFLCRPGYVQYSCLDVYGSTLTCESSGKWSSWLPECKPECGVSKEGGRVIPTVVNGTSVAQGQYPWHVGLYLRKNDEDKYQYICGGSLISDRVVLTAAHCVGPFEVADLKVAVGKYYRSWEHEEEHAVRLNVTEVRVPAEYQSVATDYAFDIALLLLSDSLAFNSFILPVCLDIHRDFIIPPNATGYVVGWGRPETNEITPEDLLSAELVINDYESCKRRLPRTLIFDKFCASKNTGITVQKGDSGGGITTVFNGLPYVFGIVSIRFIQTSIFTNLTWIPHKTWLDKEIDNFNVI